MPRLSTLALLFASGALGLVAVTACGDPDVQSADSALAAGAPMATSAVSVVPESLSFSAPLVGGGTINMADYAGEPVVLWFWAPT